MDIILLLLVLTKKWQTNLLNPKTRTGYRFKLHYKKALKKIENLEVNIENIEQAKQLKIFTPGEITHIERFLMDDSLNESPP